MIEAVRDIGGIVLSEQEDQILECLAERVEGKKKKGEKELKQHIVYLTFDPDEDKIKLDDFSQINEETAEKHLWLGNASGMNPQKSLTTSSLKYLLSQTIPNLEDTLPVLKAVREQFYCDLGEKKEKRERYVLDISKLNPNLGTVEQIKTAKNDDPKKVLEEIESLAAKEIKNQCANLSKDEIALYSVKVKGSDNLTNHSDYRSLILQEKISSFFGGRKKNTCSLCNKEKICSHDTTKLRFNYYITDKIGFASNLEDFARHFKFCEDCYRKLLVGEITIGQKFSSRLGGYNSGLRLYIIPKFLFDTTIEASDLEQWSKYIQEHFNSAKTLEGWETFKNKLQEYKRFEDRKNNFILNFLFFRKSQSAFKVLKLIKDVPPSRLDTIREAINKVKTNADKLLGESPSWEINLQKIFFLIPVHTSKGDVTEYKKLLEIYDSIFSDKPISYTAIIDKLVELIKIYRFEQFGTYNINSKNPETDLIYVTLEANLFLCLLRELKLIPKQGGETMELDLKEDMTKYVNLIGYSEEQKALFLLGYLVGEVANAQYSQDLKSKPILDKISYQGMNADRIIRLTNEVFEKLKQYKRLPFNEIIFSQLKMILDKEIKEWPLNDQENVFYTLSGYAYNTYKILKSAKGQDNKPKEEIK